MYDSVRDVFVPFTTQFEGRVHWMYLDIKGLVTTGVGNLIDPVGAATVLPFVGSDQAPATKDQIAAEWSALKGDPSLAVRGYKACEALTRLRLTDASIDALVLQRLLQNEAILQRTFADWDSWPADAQLGVLSMSWALGAAFTSAWPNFTAACRSADWSAAAANCTISDAGNPGVRPRNRADVTLFQNAAAIVAGGLDASALLYGQAPAAAASQDAGAPAVDAGP